MVFFHKFKAAYFYGKALKNFNNGKYNAALNLFEKVEKLRTNNINEEFTYLYFYLGMANLNLGRSNAALANMAKCYDIFRNQMKSLNDEHDQYYFITLTNEYSKLLINKGEKEMAKEILLYKENLYRKKR